RVFLVILFTSFSGSLVSRISGAVQFVQQFCPQPFVWPYPVCLHGRLSISPR
ncbi:hypothetical protein ECTW14301_0885, partial [Escherichia coli TW14301]